LFLYWVTGVIDLKNISQIEGNSTKIIWRLSDMEPFTGGCHYSDECSQFETHCNNCPRVFKLFKRKVATNLKNKYYYLSKSNVEFIAPSRWIEFAAKKSLVLSGKSIHYIPTPCETDIFKPLPEQVLIRKTFNLGFMAKDICDPIKNIEKTIQQLIPFLSNIDKRFKIYLIGKGNIRIKDIPKNIELIHIGTVNEKIELNLILNMLDVFISPALLENFPSSVLEAQSAGVPVICQKIGGQFEIIQHEKTGFHFSHKEELFSYLMKLIFDSRLLAELRINSREHINENYSMQSIMKKYFKLLGLNN
jgi:glycosyltransferase involved in cell wall biosynthesis